MAMRMQISGFVLLAAYLLAFLCAVNGRLIEDKVVPEPEFISLMSWARTSGNGETGQQQEVELERRELVQVCADVYPNWCVVWKQRFCAPGWRYGGRAVGTDLCIKSCNKCAQPPRGGTPKPVVPSPKPKPVIPSPKPKTIPRTNPTPATRVSRFTTQSLIPSDYPQKLLALVNQGRADNGKPPLCLNGKLSKAALAHSEDMARNNYFAHVNPQGKEPWAWIAEAGYTGGGLAENIAAGYNTVEAVYEGWKNSPGHWANILGNYRHMGIGMIDNSAYKNTYGDYWTQMFGDSPTEQCD